MSKWKVNSGQSTLHTKHNLKMKKTNPSLPDPTFLPPSQGEQTLHCMTQFLIGCMGILILKLAATIVGLD